MTHKASVLTVFYDGSCQLCAAEIGVYRRCSGAERLTFVDVSSHDDGQVTAGLTNADALQRFHVRNADGSLASGAKGFGLMWLALPGWHWLGRVVLLPGVLQLSDLAYCAFLVFRPALQWFWRALPTR